MSAFGEFALRLGPVILGSGFALLAGLTVYFILRDGRRFGTVHEFAQRSGLEPIGYLDKDPASFVGIQADPEASPTGPGRFHGARILRLKAGAWDEVTASDVLALHGQGRLSWHTTPGRQPIALGRDSLQRFIVDNMLEDPGPFEMTQASYWRGVKIAAFFIPVLAAVAAIEYWLVANGYLFRH